MALAELSLAPSLFSHPAFITEAQEFDDNQRKQFSEVLDNPDNLPLTDWDESILFFLKAIPKPIRPNALKVLGSTNLQLDWLEPILETQVKRRSLSESDAQKFRQLVVNDEYNDFFRDIQYGAISSNVVENGIAAAIWYNPAGIIPEEYVLPILLYFKSSNLLAIPYFGLRALKEGKYVRDSSGKNAFEKTFDYASLAAGVISNGLSVLSNFSTPLINLPRHRRISTMFFKHTAENIVEPFKEARSFSDHSSMYAFGSTANSY